MKSTLTIFSLGTLLLTNPTVWATENGSEFSKADLRPTGSLDITKLLVRTGEKSVINWEISYPTDIDDLILFETDDSMEVKEPSLLSVRLAGLHIKNNNGHGNNLDGVDVSNPGKGCGGPNGATDLSGTADDEAKGAKVFIQTSETTWIELFSGTSSDVRPSEILFEQLVQPGDLVQVASQLLTEGGATFSASSSIALTNGDPLPSEELEPYLSPYLREDQTIALGPREVLILFELDSTDSTSSYFDLQDAAVVVNFKEVPVPE